MNVRFLETFVWLARLRSFRLTAERLHATQAAVSSRISALEEELGVRLFERGPREATLTQDGTKALPFAEQILQLNRAMLASVGDRSKIAGLLRLGAIESIVHTWLPELLKRVRDEYPNLTLELTSDTSANLSLQLTNGHLDAALLTTPVTGADAVNAPLGSLPMGWMASPALNLSAEPLSETELAAFQIVSFARHSPPHAFLADLFAAAGETAVRINCVSSVAAIIRLVVDGFGIAVLPAAFVMRELEGGQLQTLKVAHQVPALPLVVSYRRSPDSLLAESIARLARAVMLDYSLRHGPQFALVPQTTDAATATGSADAS
ncbi:LysR family transcriptional regulator [Paraburkholderia phosphatilytica]|uniref:LysR family transcriptional regulator n=1 Tax=Paraburkholderia phosphatilytica TaxID=2282883 RepID=UPI000E51EC40|nr:LysR family transcriptional regulator [Paraburkholderia phosphatilytica]